MNENVERILSEVRDRETHWAAHLSRRRDIDHLVSGRWEHVFPDDVGGDDLPMVANAFRVNIEDIGRLFSEQTPTQRVDRATERDRKRAEDREKALMAYDNISGFWDNSEYFGMDMAAVGFAAIKTWPKLSVAPSMRFPIHERVDPRDILPETTWMPHRPTNNVIVDTTDSVDRLAQWFPEAVGELMERIVAYKARSTSVYGMADPDEEYGIPDELRVIDLYSSDKVCRVVCFDDGIYADGEQLVEIANPTGLCPIQLAYRPSWVREPYGQMDDAKGIVRTENRYFRLLLDYFVEMVYGGKLVWNVKNPEHRGPGVRYYALGPDARMESIAAEMPSPMALAMLERLESEARTTGIAPRSREGEVQLNKASAAFLERAQGQLVSVVKSLQRSFASAKEHANEVAFAFDEAMCNSSKEITGMARGRRFRLTYTPKELIRGDYSNSVSYGLRSGVDAPTWQVLQLQKQAQGNISRETFMEEDPAIEDVERELSRVRRQAMEDSLMQMLLDPNALTPEQKLTAIARFEAEADITKIAQELLVTAAAPGATTLPPGVGQDTAALPAEVGAPPSEGPLPPLQALRSIA